MQRKNEHFSMFRFRVNRVFWVGLLSKHFLSMLRVGKWVILKDLYTGHGMSSAPTRHCSPFREMCFSSFSIILRRVFLREPICQSFWDNGFYGLGYAAIALPLFFNIWLSHYHFCHLTRFRYWLSKHHLNGALTREFQKKYKVAKDFFTELAEPPSPSWNLRRGQKQIVSFWRYTRTLLRIC